MMKDSRYAISYSQFIDYVKIFVKAGQGGSGCVSFRREKFVSKGGPDGGDGGRGGHVLLRGNKQLWTLLHIKYRKHVFAENGTNGSKSLKTGADGEDVFLEVPLGTVAKNAETGEVLFEITGHDDQKVLIPGGRGGLGNTHFKTSTNQTPRYAQPGEDGKEGWNILELKLLADVGLVGYPNVGKSTLIATLSNARPQVANYEFTTLTPKLGVVHIGDYDSFMMADIPGIIEGASDGRGLGLEFLKHIERTKTLLLMIDAANYREMKYQYETLLVELDRYSETLSGRKHAIAITKIDALSQDEVNELTKTFLSDIGLEANDTLKQYKADMNYMSYGFKTDFGVALPEKEPLFVLPISSVAHLNTEALRYALGAFVKNVEEENEA